MLTLLLTAAISALPTPAQMLPAPAPLLPAPAARVSPYGPEWQWDAGLQTWVRYGTAVPVAPPMNWHQPPPVWQSAPQPYQYQPPARYYPQYVPTQPVQQPCPTGFCPWRR